jgi:hypothetical protein
MATHDSDMRRFGQWWRRSVRTGRGYAQSAALHGEGDERLGVKESRSALFWGLMLPVTAMLLAWPTLGLSLAALALICAAQVARVYRHCLRRESPRHAFLYAVFCVFGKLPQAVGQLEFRLTQPKPRNAAAAPIASSSPSTNPVA